MRIDLAIPLTLSEIAEKCADTLVLNDALVHTVCTDSREVSRGELFIALSGKTHNGNDFCEEVSKKGGYVLGAQTGDIVVSDTAATLLKLVSLYKSKLPSLLYTVAITGSVGKTTAKELTARLLSPSYKVHSTYGNFNNEIGLLHTVLSAKADTEVLVVEMGMNHEGEISRLSRAVMPDIAMITNIGTAHIGNLGSRERIASAKLEICDGMTNGYLLIPDGEPLLSSAERACKVAIDCRGDHSLFIEKERDDTTAFTYIGKKLILKNASVRLRGQHMMKGLAFSLSVADILGIEAERLTDALSLLDGSSFRQRCFKTGRYAIYDDTYSSSPEAAIAVIKAQTERNDGKVSAVLGDMLELGSESEELHKTVGKAAAAYKIRRLYTFGKFAEAIAQGAMSGGMPKDRIFTNPGTDLAITAEQIQSSYDGELLIVKASHAVHAERIYDYLKD